MNLQLLISLSSSSETPTNSLHPPSLPFHLVEEILCRLPVKHLIQLRCICKSWNSLISHDLNFAKKQLRLSTFNHDFQHLNISCTNSSSELLQFDFSISSIFTSASTTNQSPPFTCRRDYDLEVSTCDGILCVGIKGCLPFLYNPSIKKSKTLPPFKITTTTEHRPFSTLYTLVYHGVTNKYKIIALTLYLNNKSEVNVHTLGTDYWRKIDDFPCHSLACISPGIFESYQKLLEPLGSCVSFGALRGCLSVVSNSDMFSDVWIMNEYGNENSWTILLRVPHMRDFGFIGYQRVLYISEDKQVLMEFISSGKFSLVIYDSINNTFKIPTIIQNNNNDKMAPPQVYVKSLISTFF
ncbi:putative F-box domain-containing protein [Medicago truncatula]|uniref:Putative F-box domain-containing protein n=1 Tax=Medicago truncatula TaxID=3880 RepID=A0A396JW65_MEDTR|nr:putative F-box domain-containing protein [Medicago truncatula]